MTTIVLLDFLELIVFVQCFYNILSLIYFELNTDKLNFIVCLSIKSLDFLKTIWYMFVLRKVA